MKKTAPLQNSGASPKLNAIREKLENANTVKRKRRKLNEKEKNRAKKLSAIVEQLKQGVHIQNRKLKTWLTPNEFAEIANDWEHEKNSRISHHEKPAAVLRYEELLKQADFLHARCQGYLSKNNQTQGYAFENQAVSAYENALESLAEDFGVDPSLQGWFDRTLDFEAGSDLDTNPACMPRVVTSRSTLKQSGGMHGKFTIADIKLRVVQQALNDLIFESETNTTQNPKPKKLLVIDDDEF